MLFGDHPAYLEAGGSDEKRRALRLRALAPVFDEVEAALLALTDQSTQNVRVDAGVIDALTSKLGETKTVEAVATVAAYNMVSRFLVALATLSGHGR